ncbi:MAG: hypothetical protein R6U58_07595 [Bacteroidales bacterium]
MIKRIARIILLNLLVLAFKGGLFNAGAQIYVTGFGVHLGNPTGVTAKYFFSEADAVEGLVASSWQGYSLTGLYQRHFLFDDPKLRNTHWYIGTGIHLGKWNNTAPFYGGTGTLNTFGVDLAFGIESTFGDYPYTFGFNWMPSVNITGQFGLNIFQAGITGRYIF